MRESVLEVIPSLGPRSRAYFVTGYTTEIAAASGVAATAANVIAALLIAVGVVIAFLFAPEHPVWCVVTELVVLASALTCRSIARVCIAARGRLLKEYAQRGGGVVARTSEACEVCGAERVEVCRRPVRDLAGFCARKHPQATRDSWGVGGK